MNSKFKFKLIILILLFIFFFGLCLKLGNAQYFGRNKVQYERFDFKVIRTEHFDLYFYPEAQQAAEFAARAAERWYARLSRILNHELRGRQPLILYASSPHFQQTTAIPGVIGEGTGGVTELFKRRIVLPVGSCLQDTDRVIGHELVHAFQFDITSQAHPRYATAAPTALRLPLWFIEGLAEYLSIGSVDPNTAMWMRDATERKRLPQIKKLTDPQYFPYRYGQALWAYITGRWGDEMVAKIMKGVGRVGDHEAVIQRLVGLSLDDLSKDWHESMEKVYKPLSEKTEMRAKGSRVLFEGTDENRLNLSPSLSPDGKRIVFLSSRDLFSIDMYLADAETGKIIRKLVKTAVDPHFESLQFIKSSGVWDKEGKRFLFAAITKGKPALVIVDIEKGKIEKEIIFPQLGEILNPTWSPEGRFVAFSALSGGFSDIFIYDLEKNETRRMTDDPFSDLYPAWSPDGKSIAFVTDRFSTELSILSVGELELALLEPETGKIQRVEAFSRAKNINPQWSLDSKSLYFISDQNGIPNIYRKDLENGRVYQITNLFTGVSGITSESPAISIAQESGRLAYCVYENDRYSIYSLDPIQGRFEEREPIIKLAEAFPAVLPPREKPEGELIGLLKNPLFGLPKESAHKAEDYKPKLALDYVSQPQLAVGADRYGTYAGGGVALFFSDMLGYHTLVSMFQLTSRLEDSAGLVGYQNSRLRLNWGGVVERIPYVTGAFRQSYGEVLGIPAYIEEEYIYRQINYQVGGFAAYPFSQVQRFELSAGYRFIDFDRDVWTRAYSLIDGREIIREKIELPAPPGLHFAYAAAALVYDSSFFGAASPILGQAYRLEVSPFLGTINFYTILADYRRYLMPKRPFTLAFRILHYGRYGSGGEDSRLYPLYLGYESLVRGYNTGSFEMEEFSGEESFDFYRLLGSKMLITNIELRFPLFQILGVGKGYYGVFPLEFLTFFDAGLAWDSEHEPSLFGGEREPVKSAGVGLRTNLFGYLVIGVNFVKPFDRPKKGWYFQFTITPGF